MNEQLAELMLLSIGASFVQRTTGFGFGIFIMTVLPSIMPSFGEATTLSGLLALTSSTIIVWQKRRFITWHRLMPILLTFLAVSVVAVCILNQMDYQFLNRLLGVTLIAVSIYFFLFSGRIKVKTTLPMQITAGTASGLMGGFFGMQGPPAVLYFVSSEPDKDHYIAMTQTYFLVGNAVMSIARAANGFLTPTVINDYFYCLTSIIFGTLLGAVAYRRIPGKALKHIVYAYIGISGALMLLK